MQIASGLTQSCYVVFSLVDGDVAVSRGMLIRLTQEGHIFKKLVMGGDGFRNEPEREKFDILRHYNIKRKPFAALVLSLRNNDPQIAYKYLHHYEAIGGFKTLDRYHRKRLQRREHKRELKDKTTLSILNNTPRVSMPITIDLTNDTDDTDGTP